MTIMYGFFSAVYQIISILLSLSSLSSSIVAYIQASRWADVTKPQMTPMGYFVSFLWRFFIVILSDVTHIYSSPNVIVTYCNTFSVCLKVIIEQRNNQV